MSRFRSRGNRESGMRIIWKIVAVAALVIVLFGAAFLAMFDIPAPRQPVERVLPNDRFPR